MSVSSPATACPDFFFPFCSRGGGGGGFDRKYHGIIFFFNKVGQWLGHTYFSRVAFVLNTYTSIQCHVQQTCENEDQNLHGACAIIDHPRTVHWLLLV